MLVAVYEILDILEWLCESQDRRDCCNPSQPQLEEVAETYMSQSILAEVILEEHSLDSSNRDSVLEPAPKHAKS